MSFSVRQQLFFWGILLIVSIILLSFIGNILLPFVAGTALAYLLDPLAATSKKSMTRGDSIPIRANVPMAMLAMIAKAMSGLSVTV